jgi:hypothetical protein
MGIASSITPAGQINEITTKNKGLVMAVVLGVIAIIGFAVYEIFKGSNTTTTVTPTQNPSINPTQSGEDYTPSTSYSMPQFGTTSTPSSIGGTNNTPNDFTINSGLSDLSSILPSSNLPTGSTTSTAPIVDNIKEILTNVGNTYTYTTNNNQRTITNNNQKTYNSSHTNNNQRYQTTNTTTTQITPTGGSVVSIGSIGGATSGNGSTPGYSSSNPAPFLPTSPADYSSSPAYGLPSTNNPTPMSPIVVKNNNNSGAFSGLFSGILDFLKI